MRRSWMGLGIALFAACSPSVRDTTDWVVVGQGNTLAIDPGSRIETGSRVMIWSGSSPDELSVTVSEGLNAAGSPKVSWDGQFVAFVGRDHESNHLGLYRTDLRSLETSRMPVGDLDCGSADFLSDGRVVFSARTKASAPTSELGSSWALFVFDPESVEVRRITYGLSEIDPTLLADGRILYSQWMSGGDGRPSDGAFGLFAVHPDGSGVTAIHGYHDKLRLRAYPSQLPNGDLLYWGGDSVENLSLRQVDLRAPGRASLLLRLPNGILPGSYSSSGSSLLIAGIKRGLHAVTGDSEVQLSATIEASQIAGAAPRQRPQGHLSMVDHEKSSGQIFAINVRSPGEESAERLRFLVAQPGAEKHRSIGEVDLAADGSFFAEVPANEPLLFELLDNEGKVLIDSKTPIWIRPGEKRACVGCHDDPHTAPPNRRPLAVLEEPIRLLENE